MADLLTEEDRQPRTKRLRISPETSEAARTSTACVSFAPPPQLFPQILMGGYLPRCDACRYRKIKCSGTRPCRYCAKRQKECVFPEAGRKKLYSVA